MEKYYMIVMNTDICVRVKQKLKPYTTVTYATQNA